MEVKQVIIVNMAVPMPLGRMSAQVAHASMLAVLKMGAWKEKKFSIDATDPVRVWLRERFTKVVVKTWGKDSLLDLERKAGELGIPTGLMVDDGYYTALAVGPALGSTIDEITKKLSLL